MKEKTKRILSYFIMIVMVVFLFLGVKITNVSAYEYKEFNTEKGHFKYVIEDNNEITITNYSGTDKELNIPSEIDGKSVTSIGYLGEDTYIHYNEYIYFDEFAVISSNFLESIKIPNLVKIIGDYAFRGCSTLTSITISETVTSIGWKAFRGCSSLTSITIPETVTSIGSHAFEDCSSLTNINVDKNNQYFDSENGILFNLGC